MPVQGFSFCASPRDCSARERTPGARFPPLVLRMRMHGLDYVGEDIDLTAL